MKKLIFVLGVILILGQAISAQVNKKIAGHSTFVNAVCYSPGGRFIASGDFNGSIKLWNAETGILLKSINSNCSIYKLAFSSDSKQLCAGTVPLYGISASLNPFIVVYNVNSGNPNPKFDVSSKSPNFFVSEKENKLVCIYPEILSDSCSFTYDYSLENYSIVNCYKITLKSYELSDNYISSYSLTDKIHKWDFNSPWFITNNRNYIVVCPLNEEQNVKFAGKEGKIDKKSNMEKNSNLIYFYNIKENILIKKIKIINSYLRLKNILLSEDCKYFFYTAVEYFNDVIKVLDIEKDEEIKILKGHNREILCLAMHPCGRFIASGSRDNTIIIWDISTGKKIKVLKGHSDNVNSLSFSPNGRYLSSASDDKLVIIWDLNSVSKEIEDFSLEYDLNSNNILKNNEENSPLLKNK